MENLQVSCVVSCRDRQPRWSRELKDRDSARHYSHDHNRIPETSAPPCSAIMLLVELLLEYLF